MVAGAADPDPDRGVAMEDGVGHQLGDAELGALDELLAPDLPAQVGHPATCVDRSAR
jgi:hypothetical protein